MQISQVHLGTTGIFKMLINLSYFKTTKKFVIGNIYSNIFREQTQIQSCIEEEW